MIIFDYYSVLFAPSNELQRKMTQGVALCKEEDMSCGLLDNDWMLSVKERPWHDIGTVVDTAPTSADAIKIAKLNWTVKQVPVEAAGKKIAGVYANVRSDTKEALGVVRNRYQVVQNTQAFDFVDDIIKNSSGVECHYETAGSLYNGRKIFLLVRLPDKTLLGDDVENYLFFTNSHDGYSSLTAGVTNVRVVCNNTLQLALRGAKRIWRCRHTRNIADRQAQAMEALGFAVRYIDDLDTIAQELASKKVNEKSFYNALLAKDPLIKQKGKDKVQERIHAIYTQKDDLQNFKGTAWGLYNAVADFTSNTVPLRLTKSTPQRKLDSFFTGYGLLKKSQDILMAA